ncbi:hypothetical protein J1605_011815 [Eschrichtius robustus]|uniref:Uncharacterized protein n=1 Tax=Eschrichtius robustus TaxID=9764 RepID=A0AB34GII7_ESCRO|nr:hypothetical protein J1605_011815 [Eschrichtius robustus]
MLRTAAHSLSPGHEEWPSVHHTSIRTPRGDRRRTQKQEGQGSRSKRPRGKATPEPARRNRDKGTSAQFAPCLVTGPAPPWVPRGASCPLPVELGT